jgi:hypothetical protein
MGGGCRWSRPEDYGAHNTVVATSLAPMGDHRGSAVLSLRAIYLYLSRFGIVVGSV